MRYVKINVTYRAKTPVYLPPFTGFTIRGALGQWLKRRHCIYENYSKRNCHRCRYIKTCLYGYLYEYGQDVERLDALPFVVPPKPYSLIPPQGGAKEVGETFTFSILVFHRSPGWLVDGLVEGLNNLVEIGKYKSRGYGKVEVEEIKVGEARVERLPPLKERLRIEFLTPAILMRENALLTRPTLYDILTAAGRKRYLVSRVYYREEPHYDVKAAVESQKAEEVVVKLTGRSIRRWSERRKRHEVIRAIQGSITYNIGGLSKPAKNLLRDVLGFAQAYGIGRRTSAGLGRIRVSSYSP